MNRSLRTTGNFWALTAVVTLSGLLGSSLLADTRLRVMSANISSGNHQTYDPGHGIRIFQGLKPDVVAIQEFNYGNNTEAAVREMVNLSFGKEYYYYREPNGDIPNGIISRYPILEAGYWKDSVTTNRGFVWAKLQLPENNDMWVVSVHFSTRSTENRSKQAREVVRQIQKKIPDGAYLIIAGDLNTKNRNEEAVKVLKTVTSDNHVPVGSDGKPGTNAGRNSPYDWVLPSPSLDERHVPVEIVADSRELKKEGVNMFINGLVFDSRSFSFLEAVAPVKSSDSASSNMQHMAVVKDFVVPPDLNTAKPRSCARVMAFEPPEILTGYPVDLEYIEYGSQIH